MKKLIFAVLMLFSSIAFADRVDIIENSTDMDYCSSTTAMFHAGANARVGGVAREINELDKKYYPMIEHGFEGLPKDSMWVIGWDQMNDREKEFMKKKVFAGWDEADSILNKNASLTDEDLVGMAQIYFEGCMYQRTKEKHVEKSEMRKYLDQMNPVASSRRLVCEARAKNLFDKCMEWKD